MSVKWSKYGVSYLSEMKMCLTFPQRAYPVMYKIIQERVFNSNAFISLYCPNAHLAQSEVPLFLPMLFHRKNSRLSKSTFVSKL